MDIINECIETERLYLKVLDESYAEKVLDFYNKNYEFLKPWEPERNSGFYTLEYQKNFLKRELENIFQKKQWKVWIFKKEDKDFNQIIGSVALNEIVRGCFQSCFIGYKMDKDNINKGYMTEAVKKTVEYAFNTLKLHRIEANIMPRNIGSLKVVKKCGFVNEGMAKKYLKINGIWEDHIHMVILNDKLEMEQN